MRKILFLQGIYNFSLTERWIRDVEEATGLEVVHHPLRYGLTDSSKQQELIGWANATLAASDGRYIILAHSFGGILAHCLTDEAYAKVDRIITLATPHRLPFGGTERLAARLPYRRHVPVPQQESHGFYLDSTVPFPFTRGQHTHANKMGTHTRVPNRKAFFRTLIPPTEVV